jgi:hypothetical protein
MNTTIKSLAIATLFALTGQISALELKMDISGVANGIGTANGTDFTLGNIVRFGYFDISDTTIAANATDYAFLNSHFFQYGPLVKTGYAGFQPFGSSLTEGPETYLASSQFTYFIEANPVQGAASFGNKPMYLWAFNQTALPSGSTYDLGTEIGIFKGVNLFPTGADENTQNGGIELSSVGIASIVVGSFGTGTTDPSPDLSSPNGDPLYNTVAVAPIPEPSAAVALISGVAMLCGIRRRRANA